MSQFEDDDPRGGGDDPFGKFSRSQPYDRYLRELDIWRRRAARSQRGILAVVGALAVLVLLAAAFYQVQPEEVGVVVRLGQYVRTTEPGLRVKIPFVEQVHKIPVQRQLKEEFGFRTDEPGIRSTFSAADFTAEAMMLTGDLNVAIVEWIVQYSRRPGTSFRRLK